MKLTENEILTLMTLIGSEEHFNDKYMDGEGNKELKEIHKKLENELMKTIIETNTAVSDDGIEYIYNETLRKENKKKDD